MKIFLLIIAEIISSLLYSQNELSKFEFINSKIHLYAIGEDHTEKNAELQFELIKYLQMQVHLKTLILEVPVEVGEVLNRVVLTGENKNLIDDLFRYFPSRAKKNMKSLLDSVISLNQGLTQQNKISIRGIDFVYYPAHQSIISTLQIVFPELKECTIPLVQKELFSKKKLKLNKEESLLVLNQLLEDVLKHEVQYRDCLGSRFENYQTLLNNTVHYKELLKSEHQDAFREGILSKNLISTIDTNSVCLMICGYAHLARETNDEELLWDSPFKSMIANANIVYSGSIFTIVTQYYKEGNWFSRWLFGETNLLNDSMETYIDKKKTKYKVFTGEELKKHSKAASRCDMIIIQNKYYKKRR